VRIYNARPLLEEEADAPTLDREGFAFQQHETKVKNFFDDAEVQERYYPEVIDLIKSVTGAIDVQVFDHTVRAPEGKAHRQPVHRVHNDYTIKSGVQRLNDITNDPEKLATRLNHRFAFINAWRPITSYPVEELPLAVSDSRTMKHQDFVATDLIFNHRTGEIYYVPYKPEHQFYYFPQMHRDEVLLFKGYDSVDDGHTARLAAHTAFQDPTSPSDARPRESIEVRAVAFFAPSTPCAELFLNTD
jgi:hypothetical protein